MTVDAVFVQDGDRFQATDLALGPWYPGALHGGAPAALIVHAVNGHAAADGLRLARITYEFVRPVPQAALAVAVEVVRPGRRVTLMDAVLRDGDGHRGDARPGAAGAPLGGERSGGRTDQRPAVPGPRAGRPQRLGGPAAPRFCHRRHGDPVRQGAVPGVRRGDRVVSPAPPAGRRAPGSPAGDRGGGRRLRQRHRRRPRLGLATCSSTRTSPSTSSARRWTSGSPWSPRPASRRAASGSPRASCGTAAAASATRSSRW